MQKVETANGVSFSKHFKNNKFLMSKFGKRIVGLWRKDFEPINIRNYYTTLICEKQFIKRTKDWYVFN